MHLLVLFTTLLCASHWTSACDIRARGVSDADKKAIVKKHNELRAKIANGKENGLPSASNMLEMEWDDHLAKKAQQWAERCEFEHDDPIDKNGEEAGQNIAWEGRSDKTPDWVGRIQSFYKEVKDINPNNIHKYKSDKETGHFTQSVTNSYLKNEKDNKFLKEKGFDDFLSFVPGHIGIFGNERAEWLAKEATKRNIDMSVAWAKSNKVGCGYVRYREDDSNEFLYGCNYSPGGNVEGKPIYKVGKPCSKCGGCGSIPGLCKLQ